MKITLIMPAVGRKNHEPYVRSWKMEPLALALLAGLTPEDIEVRFYDDRIEPIPYDEATDLVAVNVETYTAKRSYHIAREYRQRGVPVVLGGYHPTLVPQEAGRHADAILIGEAEGIWEQICEDARAKQLRTVYQRNDAPVLKGCRAKRTIFNRKTYLPVTLIESARGCPYACQFCSVSSFFRHTYRPRPIPEIIEEIRQIGKSIVFFVDDNITCDPQRAKQLFQALIPLNIKWISQGSIDMANDESMLTLMKASGCLGVLMGFESLDQKNLTQMGKQWNLQYRSYEQALQRFRDHGIVIYGTFVFGYDQDTLDTVQETLEFAIKQKMFLAAFNHLVPFPGTPLYRHFKSEGRLLSDNWWLDPRYKFGDVAFHPRKMSAEDLSRACLRARQQFYSVRSISQRFDARSNCHGVSMLWNYILYNFFSGREVDKRQGLPLGKGLN